MVWKKKRDEGRFLSARNGDCLAAPFQCEYCWTVNIMGREVKAGSLGDQRLCSYIRRVNLDIFWSREPGTVGGTLSNVRKGRRLSEELGMKPVPMPLGPWPVKDTQGMQIAIEMLRASQGQGKNDESYVQFDSIRKLRGSYSNAYEATPQGCAITTSMKGGYGKTLTLTRCPTDSKLFQMFMRGCERRMGRLVMQEVGLSVEVLHEILGSLKQEISNPLTFYERKRLLVVSGAAFVILYAGALRGGEVFLVEASELSKLITQGRDHTTHPHVVVPLMGRFKGETGERNVLLAFTNVSTSGFRIREWVEVLVILLRNEGKHRKVGPAICDEDGFVLERSKLNGVLHQELLKVQASKPWLLDLGVKVEDKMSVHRSFRRGATTRAKEMNLSEKLVDMNNRWRKVQEKSGGMPSLPMSELYVEISQALGSKLAFSKSL